MIDAYASRPHYLDHCAPVWHALPEEARGSFVVPWDRLHGRAIAMGIHPVLTAPLSGLTLVAAYADVRRARQVGARRLAFLEHGAGQSYGGDPRTAHQAGYAGGHDRHDHLLFLVPNEHAADRWRAAYPHARVEIVGCPRLDTLPAREPYGHVPTIALTAHFRLGLNPETRPALDHYRKAIQALTKRYRIIGHGHPRGQDLLRGLWRRMGVEFVPEFADVCRRADLLIGDNTSALYEFASTGRPVVVLDAPWYRRDVDHGLRFWEAADVGVRVSHPEGLADAVATALIDAPGVRAERERALALVYAYRAGAAQRAAVALVAALGSLQEAAA